MTQYNVHAYQPVSSLVTSKLELKASETLGGKVQTAHHKLSK